MPVGEAGMVRVSGVRKCSPGAGHLILKLFDAFLLADHDAGCGVESVGKFRTVEGRGAVVVVFEFLRENIGIDRRAARECGAFLYVVERTVTDLGIEKKEVEKALFGIGLFKKFGKPVRVFAVSFRDPREDFFPGELIFSGVIRVALEFGEAGSDHRRNPEGVFIEAVESGVALIVAVCKRRPAVDREPLSAEAGNNRIVGADEVDIIDSLELFDIFRGDIQHLQHFTDENFTDFRGWTSAAFMDAAVDDGLMKKTVG